MLILFVSFLHILWGVLLLINQETVPISATWALLRILGTEHVTLRALMYITAGVLPFCLTRWPGSLLGLASVIPQQILITLSGISALSAILNGHFADGVIRPEIFIAMDQAPYLILAVLHASETMELWKK